MVRHRRRRLELPRARLHQRVQRGRRVDGVADPRVPPGLDVRGVVVVLGVLDPARAQGQLLVVLEELVARAVRANERACLGVADVLSCVFLAIVSGNRRRGGFEGVPPSGQSSPGSRSVCAQLGRIRGFSGATVTDLDANLSQVAKRSGDGRHAGRFCRLMCSRDVFVEEFRRLFPMPLRAIPEKPRRGFSPNQRGSIAVQGEL